MGDGRHLDGARLEGTGSRADQAGRVVTLDRPIDPLEHQLDAPLAPLSTQIVRSNRETGGAILATVREGTKTRGGRARATS